MKKIFAAGAALFAGLIIFGGCGEKEFTTESHYFYSMNTQADLIISDTFDSKKTAAYDGLCREITDKLVSIENSLSANVANSPVSAFNAAAAGETVLIDYTAYQAFSLALDMYNLTEGYYNPAVYYSVQAYGFNEASDMSAPIQDRIPPESVTAVYAELSSHFGETQVYQGEDNRYYAVKPSATAELNGQTLSLKLDLGGIGKGIAVDEINALIESYGFAYGYFSFGSSSIACKRHYKNGDYSLALTNPRSDGEGGSYAKVAVKDTCLSTSGDYQQFFLLDGKRYSHVFNPFTGRPVETGIMSATVIGGTAGEGDALTTAIMAMGREKAVEFIKQKLSGKGVAFTYEKDEGYGISTNIEGLESMHSLFKVDTDVS